MPSDISAVRQASGAPIDSYTPDNADFLLAPVPSSIPHCWPMEEPSLERPVSQMCTAGQLESPAYAAACDAIGETPRAHRKQWEFAYIYSVLLSQGVLRPGARGIGFGVGQEPLPAAFVAKGAQVVATDLSNDAVVGLGWDDTNQHHGGQLDKLYRHGVCSMERLELGVSLADVDMNFIPDHFRGFDFCWSSCALEHLGSIHRSLRFIENSLDVLRPGGIAVHTTELNLLSERETLDFESTVILRRADFLDLADLLTQRGMDVLPLNFHPGFAPLDRHIDLPPYSADEHLKLLLAGTVSTSFGIAIRKPAQRG